MDEEILEEKRTCIQNTITMLDKILEAVKKLQKLQTEEHPPETPTAPPVDAKRLDRIWKYLQAFIPKDIYSELREWAVKTFGYKYYGGTQKYPIDLRTAVCDKLSTFTESQIAEIEKILEVKE